MPMGKAELTMLMVVFGVCFLLLIALTAYLTRRHGTKVPKSLKKSKSEILGYRPPKSAISAVSVAFSCFVFGVVAAFKSLDE